MNDYDYFLGIDWGSEYHQACLIDTNAQVVGEHRFAHSADGLNSLVSWTSKHVGNLSVGAAIEVPHGPVVDTLMERGFAVYAINPKQLDRFRDRVTPSGAKDDRLDARVLALSLRTDAHSFRFLQPKCAEIVKLRELTHLSENLTAVCVQLLNQIRQHLWRYYPQMLEVNKDLSKPWIRQLWQMAPTPARAKRLRKSSVEKLLKKNRIRRIGADEVLEILKSPAVTVAPGTEEGICIVLKALFAQLEVNQKLAKDTDQQTDQVIEQLRQLPEDESGHKWQRDIDILSSITGVGTKVLATLLAEASELLQLRDYYALRCMSGVAPVTRQSGKSISVKRRLACNHRLRNALTYWAQCATIYDEVSKAKYNSLRERGYRHNRALRTVGDRILNVACAMLRDQTMFNRDLRVLKKAA